MCKKSSDSAMTSTFLPNNFKPLSRNLGDTGILIKSKELSGEENDALPPVGNT